MKIAVLGGTFNPVHIGHLMLAEDVRIEFGYDRIIFIPAFIPPHKEYRAVVSDEDRVEMLRLAVQSNVHFEVDDLEIRRGGISYTYDTIVALEKKYGDVLEGKIGLIIGDDLIEGFSKWHRPNELLEKVDLILGRRLTGTEKIQSEFPFRQLKNPVFPVSSTEFRKRCLEGSACRYLVPDAVYGYIQKKSLYGVRGDEGSTLEKVTEFARLHEKPSRFEHSIRVAQTARMQCKKFGLDEEKGYFAGIAHDIAKDFSDDKMIGYAMQDGFEVTQIEKTKPSLLHGRVAAIVLEKEFGVKDRDVLEAVRFHTFGNKGMGGLAKVIFVADKIEPGRPHVTDGYLAQFEKMSLDEIVKFVLEENILYLENKGLKVAESTFEFLDSLK